MVMVGEIGLFLLITDRDLKSYQLNLRYLRPN